MDRVKRLKHLLTTLEQVIQLLEQADAGAKLSLLKACHAEASHLLEMSQGVSSEALQELSIRVRSAIHPGMMGQEADVARIAMGLTMLARAA